MSTKQLGLLTILASALAGVALGTVSQLRTGSVPALMLALPAIGIVLGLLILYGDQVARLLSLQDELEEVQELLSDDVEELLAGRVGPPVMYGLLTAAAAVVHLVLVFRYQKWVASWGSINVVIVAICVTVAVAFLGVNTDWFRNRWSRFPSRVFFIPAIGFAFVLLIGVHWAEPAEYGGMSRQDRFDLVRSDGYWLATRAARSDLLWDVSDAGISSIDLGGFADFDCDDDICGYIALVIFLVVLVIVLITASALIPHFWVVASVLLWVIMLLVTVRELLYHPDHPEVSLTGEGF